MLPLVPMFETLVIAPINTLVEVEETIKDNPHVIGA
jgi:hypothetical protein